MKLKQKIQEELFDEVSIAPLVFFRIGFGLLMLISLIRFWYNGWIEKLYIEPKLFFSYYGFEWVKPLGEQTYLIFILCGLSCVLITLGYKYRLAIILFFLSFTYIELMDKTTYLNHYYFVSLISFLMIFLPLNKSFSLDSYFKKQAFTQVPAWCVLTIKLSLSVVYFYAGLAKANSDWLMRAMPLKIWITSKYDLPIIGDLFSDQVWFHYFLSWSGMFYDLAIPFLLFYRPTRKLAFFLVVVFHLLTRYLFPIGMFPYIMIFSTIIFFESKFHLKIISWLSVLLRNVLLLNQSKKAINHRCFRPKFQKGIVWMFVLFFTIQVLLPFRNVLYPGEFFGTEQGCRFSCRVRLIEKMGSTTFKIVNGKTGDFFMVNNSDFLTSFQEKQMAFQPDFILQYAHYLGDHFSSQGHQNVEVYAESFVALNGRPSQRYVDPNVDLYKEKESLFKHKEWLLPFKDKIYGL